MALNRLGQFKGNRTSRGNMIVWSLAVILMIMGLLFFCLKYVRFLGAHQEQTTAIQAASLAVANDLTRIIFDDNNFGLVGLADYAPVAPNTKADDGESMPVRGINTLMATVRLDMIIADQIGDNVMQQLALRDYTNLMKTKDFLVTELEQAMQPGGAAVLGLRDVDGHAIDPYADATAAYQSNVIRMTGLPNTLDVPSLKISLGCFAGSIGSNTPIPQPSSFASLPASTDSTCQVTRPDGTSETCYKAYINFKYNTKDFVFAAADAGMKLVDPKMFTTTIASLPYVIPSVVRVEADQVYADANWNGGSFSPTSRRVHCVACAVPGYAFDPRPAPGGLKLTFPGGTPPEFTKPGDFSNPGFTTPGNLFTPPSGDYPPSPLTPVPWGSVVAPGINPYVPIGYGNGLYDWLRRAGPRANVKAIVKMQDTPFSVTNQPVINVYSWNMNGTINYQVVADDPARTLVASHRQEIWFIPLAVTSSNGVQYDVNGTDTVAQPGRILGGQHGGEPITDLSLKGTPVSSGATITAQSKPTASPLSLAGLLGLILGVGVFVGRMMINRSSIAVTLMMTTLVLAGAAVSIQLCACAYGGSVPPSAAVTSNTIGPRVARTTYTQNGLAVELEVRQH